MNDPKKPEAFKAVYVEPPPPYPEEQPPPDAALAVAPAPLAISLDRIPFRAWAYLVDALPAHPGEMEALHATLAMKAADPAFVFEVTEELVTAMLGWLFTRGKVSLVQTEGGPRYSRIDPPAKLDPGEELPKSWIEQLRALVEEGRSSLPPDHWLQLRLIEQSPLPRTTIALEVFGRFPKLPPEHPGAFLWSRAIAAVEAEQRAATSPENLRACLISMGIAPDRVTPDVLKVGVSWGQGGLPVDEILRRLERISEAGLRHELEMIDKATVTKRDELVLEREPGAQALTARLVAEIPLDERGAVDASRDREERPVQEPEERKPLSLYEAFCVLAEKRGVAPGQLPREGDLPAPFSAVWADLAAVLDQTEEAGRLFTRESWSMRLDQATRTWIEDWETSSPEAFVDAQVALLLPTKEEAAATRKMVEDIKEKGTLIKVDELGSITISAEVFLANIVGLPDLSAHVGPVPVLLSGEQLFVAYGECVAEYDHSLPDLIEWGHIEDKPVWNALAGRYSERLFQAELGRQGALDELKRYRGQLAGWQDVAGVLTAEEFADKQETAAHMCKTREAEIKQLREDWARGFAIFTGFTEGMTFNDVVELLRQATRLEKGTKPKDIFLGAERKIRALESEILSVEDRATSEGIDIGRARASKEITPEINRLVEAREKREAELTQLRAIFEDFDESMTFNNARELLRAVAQLENGLTLKDLILGTVGAIRSLRGRVAAQGATISDLDAEVRRLRETRPLGAPEKSSPYQGENAFLLSINDLTSTGQIVQLRQRVIDADLCAEAFHRKLGLNKPLGFAGAVDEAMSKMDLQAQETERAHHEIRKLLKRLSALRTFLVTVCSGKYRTLEEVSTAAGKAFTDDVAHDGPHASTISEAVFAHGGRTLDPASSSRDGAASHVEVDLRVRLSPLELLGCALGGEIVERAKIRTENDPGAVSLRERSATVEWPWWVPRFGSRPG